MQLLVVQLQSADGLSIRDNERCAGRLDQLRRISVPGQVQLAIGCALDLKADATGRRRLKFGLKA